MPSLDHLLAPERQVLGWFQPLRPEVFAPNAFPVVIGEFEEGRYYASPVFGVPGFKIGKFHHLNEPTTADGLDRECRDEDEAVLRQAVARYFPDANGPAMSLRACMFTNTPDEHFIIDALPGAPNVYVRGGVLWPRLQVLQRCRRDHGGPVHSRRDRPRHLPLPPGPLCRERGLGAPRRGRKRVDHPQAAVVLVRAEVL